MTPRQILIDGSFVDAVPFDVTIDASKRSLERTMRALLRYHGWFTDAFVICADGIDGCGPRDSVFLRVFLPEGYDAKFAADAKVVDLRTPPKVHLNCGGLNDA